MVDWLVVPVEVAVNVPVVVTVNVKLDARCFMHVHLASNKKPGVNILNQVTHNGGV